ncbi:protein ANTAGONIST OF LIKE HETEROCHROMATIN PROTEIN 1-like isoform X1 [Mercurialis annua]|uniref:protein ANTAGONIST OF LIKE HETEROCHROMATIN PROTEIN 1-like isoform X1 n=1 Tax=Mercurialis annua TaxID=3986 RepID=UPI002160A743|nr:protein ANTAGONIST OF LIKE HETEROCHROMATIN PROTEIN 1-like isoform X1 [Mercurialis annua]
MESKKLAALITSLISDLLLLLLLSPTTDSIDSDYNFNFNCYANLIYSQEMAASLSILNLSKKRKRTHLSEFDSDATYLGKKPKLGNRLTELYRVAHTPDMFRTFFKMKASTFEWLSGLLEPLLDCRDPIGSRLNLSAELRLGVGLFRLATGSNYSEIADRFGVTESVTRFCVKQLCRVLCTNFRFWVAFPSATELKSVSNEFEKLTGMPNCCGVIDCTRFQIDGDHDDYSVAAQIVVDSSSRILSIVTGFRGEKGSSRALKSTTLYKDIESGKLLNSSSVSVNGVSVNQYLIGKKYPLLPWLMVPFLDALPNSDEERFNCAIDEMHLSSLRAICSLKNWGVLSKPIEEELKTGVAVIGACSILHNALLMRGDDSALLDLDDCSVLDHQEHYVDGEMEEIKVDKKAFDIRNALVTRVIELNKS